MIEGASSVLLDTGLVVLLVVGSFDTALIARHKNTKNFSRADFGVLARFLQRPRERIVTPQILTETSNLLRQIGDPQKSMLTEALGRWVPGFEERFVSSRQACANSLYPRLGLPDAATLEALVGGATLLTADTPLYVAAHSIGLPAVDFNHHRPGLR